MNTRICSIVVAATLVTFSSGCSGMRNFLFGRGARCGMCSSSPAASTPYVPAPNPVPTYQQPAPTYQQPAPVYQQPAPCQAPAYQAPAYQAPAYQAPAYQTPPCQCPAPCPQQSPCQNPYGYQTPPANSGGFLSGIRNFSCGLFGRNRQPAPQYPAPAPCQSYSPPCYSCYGSGNMGECGCGDEYVSDPYMSQPGMMQPGMMQPGMMQPGMIQEDDFTARKYDSDGNQIIWEGPATEL